MPICLSKITTSPPCHSSISETSVVRANAVCAKKHLQVSHPSEIYVCIRFCYHVILWLLPDICIHKHLQVISGILQGISNYIGANAITIVRITGLIIAAFVFWICAHIDQCAVQNIKLVVYPVIIPIYAAMKLRYSALIVILRPDDEVCW